MTWMTRRPEPDPEPPAPVVISRPLPRLGGGLCWSLIAAEIATDARRPDLPNPWSPDPEGDEAA